LKVNWGKEQPFSFGFRWEWKLPAMNKRILFVDDEPMILQGIQHSLRGMRAEWEVQLAGSGAEALETMAQAAFDVVITDMRMPGMDGAQLLDLVKARFPRTVRIILSGQSDRETILRSVGPSHQYLSKPCDLDELKQRLIRAFALRDMLNDTHLKEVIGRLKTVPSLPALYVAVTEALRSPETPMTKIGDLIAKDMGMCAKVLQLANSAFFGLSCHVSSPQHAVSLIGIENLKALVLSVQVFSDLGGHLTQDLGYLWDHSMTTASFAKAIARAEGASRGVMDDAFTAGLLHDVGRLVLACAFGAEYQQVLKRTAEPGVLLAQCEGDAFGCTHNGVGAYLLGLWGLTDSIVEAVAWHHQPAQAEPVSFSALIAVHAADHYDNQLQVHPPSDETSVLDEPLLTQLGLQKQLVPWEKACREVASRSELNA
jgi:HD-like signal output (HDOD) protein/CheY-like chemotaxis protein